MPIILIFILNHTDNQNRTTDYNQNEKRFLHHGIVLSMCSQPRVLLQMLYLYGRYFLRLGLICYYQIRNTKQILPKTDKLSQPLLLQDYRKIC